MAPHLATTRLAAAWLDSPRSCGEAAWLQRGACTAEVMRRRIETGRSGPVYSVVTGSSKRRAKDI